MLVKIEISSDRQNSANVVHIFIGKNAKSRLKGFLLCKILRIVVYVSIVRINLRRDICYYGSSFLFMSFMG